MQNWGVKVKSSTSNKSIQTATLAIASTLGFYLIAPRVPGIESFVERYFCSHFIEYVCTGLFFAGSAILFQKCLSIRNEKLVLRRLDAEINGGRIQQANDDTRQAVLKEWCNKLPTSMTSSVLYVRVTNTLQYLGSSGRRGIEDHLRYLAELASDRLNQSYSTIRTVTWAIPILGFLGTVIGITMAIANLTPEQLDSSLADVTQGLGFAFDTTALALAMSIVLVFAAFSVERVEQLVLNEVEQFGIEYVLPWFSSEDTTAEVATVPANPSAYQADVWNDQLTQLRETWQTVLDQHARQLSATMADEVQRTLKLHRMTSEDTSQSFSNAVQSASQSIVDQTDQLLESFSDRIESWQNAIQQSSKDSVQQSEALHQLGSILLRLSESEERLAALQQQLNENLHSVQLANTMEQSANSLTAAVHVLSARTNLRAA